MDFKEIKGFGEKRISLLSSAGIKEPADLISYFPSRYIDTKNLSDLKLTADGDRVVILACTLEKPKVTYIRKRLSLVKVKFTYDGKTVWCSWFNQPYMAKNIVPERYYYISGKLKKFKSSYEISAPELLPFTGEEPSVIPVYKPIGKVSSKLIKDAIKVALDRIKVNGFIPNDIARDCGVGDVNDAIKNIHFPTTMESVEQAKRTLALERLGYTLSAFSLIKKRTDTARKNEYEDNMDLLRVAVKSLPFTLTSSQIKGVESIIGRLHSHLKLNCLLEGDVGTGKTIVAFLCMYYAVLSGYQTALMCPTEILARQHYEKAVNFFEKLGVKCAFVSGSTIGKEREELAEKIKSGEISVLVGTHACFSDDVEFSSLGLVVTDEQHRFGVAQRAKLENKAQGVDCLVMSATPIPRTLALTLYGDLDRIVIDQAPAKKASTTTQIVPKEKIENMWKYIFDKAEKGEKTFVVSPRISGEDDEKVSAESIFEQRKALFGDKIALLHGKMKEKDKAKIMHDFAYGKIMVLVATTVVEVGIDVPSATTMVIYDADRFGLSQLHQLRGRVGRGEINSYCFVLSDSTAVTALDRLKYFSSNSDGFALSEYDFAVRGAGDFFGYSQHGEGAFPSDKEIIFTARTIKERILACPDAVKKLEKTISERKYEFFSNITLN